jgi:hypothetical protein
MESPEWANVSQEEKRTDCAGVCDRGVCGARCKPTKPTKQQDPERTDRKAF